MHFKNCLLSSLYISTGTSVLNPLQPLFEAERQEALGVPCLPVGPQQTFPSVLFLCFFTSDKEGSVVGA